MALDSSRFQPFSDGQNDIVGPLIASAATIAPTHPVHHVNGAAAIVNITPPSPTFRGKITIIPDSVFTWTAAGNIALAGTSVANKTLEMFYDGFKWTPNYIA